MTYNLLTGGRDGGRSDRLDSILELVEGQCPDILALQECNRFEEDGHQVLHRIERRLGMRGLLGRAGSGFHVALFVKQLPVVSSSVESGWCKHAMLEATLQWGDQELRVSCVHHNPFSGTARLQEAEFLAGRSRPDQMQLLLGDFNACSPVDAERVDLGALPARFRARQALRQTRPPALDSRSIDALLEAEYVDLQHELAGNWTATAPTRLVAPAHRFPMRVDYAFASPALARHAVRATVIQDPPADRASDHYPVVVDFEG